MAVQEGILPVPKKRFSCWSANQFTPEENHEQDFLLGTGFPIGSKLLRTWIDVRFNQFGVGTLPPEFVNMTGPWVWGVCMLDESSGTPGILATDDDFDWVWREMITFGPSTVAPDDTGGDHLWSRCTIGQPGMRSSKGERVLRHPNNMVHFCWNLADTFGSTPYGLFYEVFIHQLYDVPA